MKQLFKRARERYHYSLILLKELVRTDFKVRYQDSVLGYLWSLLRPLFMFLVLYVIFVQFLGIGQEVPHWPVALFLGLVLWEFFSEVTSQGLKAIVGSEGLIRKINMPKYIIIVASSLSALINLLLNLVVVAIFLVVTKTPVNWTYFIIPLLIVELYIFSLGVAFFLSTIFVRIRDIDFIWEIFLRAGMYAVAVMYPMSRIFDVSHIAGQLLLFNPVAQVIQDARHDLLPQYIPTTHTFFAHYALVLVPYVIVMVVLLIGAWYFRRRSPYFAEEV